jgi:spermidine/putrescine transport system substrate-binding protein
MIRWFSALLLLWAGVAQAQDELVIYTWEHYLAPEVKSRFEKKRAFMSKK